jgi:two-component sensor histidine kinase
MALLAASVIGDAAIQNNAERRLHATVDELRTTVADRDMLLREVYHRVKNNLQQINALIHMEVNRLSDPSAKESLRSTTGRVQALAMVHTLIVSSDKPSKIETDIFLKDLCSQIARSFGADQRQIVLTVDADNDTLDIDPAICIGLLINELVANSFKHAFVERADGNINFRYKQFDGMRVIDVEDDGVGLEFDADQLRLQTSSGSRIIRALCGQLDARLSVRREGGTKISVVLPRETLTGGFRA